MKTEVRPVGGHSHGLLVEALNSALLRSGAVIAVGHVDTLMSAHEKRSVSQYRSSRTALTMNSYLVVGVAAVAVGVDDAHVGADGVAALMSHNKDQHSFQQQVTGRKATYSSIPVDGNVVDQGGAAAVGIPVQVGAVARAGGD